MFTHLHVHSAFSMLDGAARLDDLIARAKELGMPALALTDHSLVGAVRFYQRAREAGVKPILGAEIVIEGGGHLTLLAKDSQGYAHLCRLVSSANLRDPLRQSEPFVTKDELATYCAGLIALSGCAQGEIPGLLARGKSDEAAAAARWYHDVFAADFYLELIKHPESPTSTPVAALVALGKHLRIPCVATNNVHYTRFGGHRLHEVLSCIRANTTLAAYPFPRTTEAYLTSPRQMAALFRDMSPGDRADHAHRRAVQRRPGAGQAARASLPRARRRDELQLPLRAGLCRRAAASTSRCATPCSSAWKKSWPSSTSWACATTSCWCGTW